MSYCFDVEESLNRMGLNVRVAGLEGQCMWHEYPIQSNFDMQKRIIRSLRVLVEQLEADRLIAGYCFDHYFPNPDELRIRFQYTMKRIERMLRTN